MKTYLLAGLLLAVPAAATAQSATVEDARDARCILVKSTILGLLMNQPETDPATTAGITSHITYFYGRLSRTMSDQAISNLVVQEAGRNDLQANLQAFETECDSHMQGPINGMVALGERLKTLGK